MSQKALEAAVRVAHADSGEMRAVVVVDEVHDLVQVVYGSLCVGSELVRENAVHHLLDVGAGVLLARADFRRVVCFAFVTLVVAGPSGVETFDPVVLRRHCPSDNLSSGKRSDPPFKCEFKSLSRTRGSSVHR